MRATFRQFVFVAAAIAVAGGVATPAGLPPGQHTAKPKYWRVVDRSITNYTPLEFDNRIENLTPARDGGLWFSIGSSIERIYANGGITHFVMPQKFWHISGATQAGGNIWFSAGQSGKVVKIDANRHMTFTQVVPRRFFPDIRDLVVNRAGDMWFVDSGRRSIGYRSASGRLVEHPIPDDAWPVHMQHCMGRLWLVADTPRLSRLAVLDDDLRVRWYASNIPKQSMIAAMSCDSHDRLWLTLNNRFRSSTVYAARIDSRGDVKMFGITATWAGDIASDSSGGAWISVGASEQYAPGLVHVDANGVNRTYALPTLSYGPGAIALGPDGAIWLGIGNGNSPLSVARLR